MYQSTIPSLEKFYRGDAIEVPVIIADSSGVARGSDEIALSESWRTIREDDVQSRLSELNETWQVIEVDDRTFEIGIVNDHVASGADRLFVSTYSSSISTNPGNAYELALEGALNPDRRIVYVSSLGNGQTSFLSDQEAKAYRATGRLMEEVDGETVAFPIIKHLAEGLLRQDIHPVQLSSDSAGAIVNNALAMMMKPDQIKEIYENGAPRAIDRSLINLAGGMIVLESLIHAKQNQKLSVDRWRLTNEHKRTAETLMPVVYGSTRGRHLKVLQLLTVASALGRGPKHGDPQLLDALAVTRQHPEVKLTMAHAEADPLYSIKNLASRIEWLGRTITRDSDVKFKSITVENMSHAYHGYFPGLAEAIKRLGLSGDN